MMAELKQMQEALRQKETEEVRSLRQENDALRQALAQRDELLAERERAAAERDQALGERDEALAALTQAERKPAAQATAPAQPPEQVQELQATVARLRLLVEEKDRQLADTRQRAAAAAPMTEGDMESYEAELNQFRLQLEADREKLGKEIGALRARNTELDDATRELELEMSRERAEMARERTRVERLREEMRLELERVQREAGMRERLAPVQKLREEITDRRQGPSTPQPNQPDAALNGRLRTLRNRINDPE
jgi:hypothetical protein